MESWKRENRKKFWEGQPNKIRKFYIEGEFSKLPVCASWVGSFPFVFGSALPKKNLLILSIIPCVNASSSILVKLNGWDDIERRLLRIWTPPVSSSLGFLDSSRSWRNYILHDPREHFSVLRLTKRRPSSLESLDSAPFRNHPGEFDS